MLFLCYSTCKSQAEDLFQVADSLINLDCHSLELVSAFTPARESLAVLPIRRIQLQMGSKLL